jgi:alcohol dehydrogenase
VAVDLADGRLAFARELGATATFDAKDPDCAQQVRSATDGGVEFAFELAGSVRALELAYRITRRGGTTVTAGLPPPTAAIALPAVTLVAEERTLKGSYIGTAVPSRDIPRFIQLYRRGRLPVDRLMSGTLGLEQINEGFDRLRDGRAIRQILTL